jgi:hypothetical protein
MPTLRQNGHVNRLASQLASHGITVKAKDLHEVLKIMDWNVDLAVDAFLMQPPPSWLLRITGPLART